MYQAINLLQKSGQAIALSTFHIKGYEMIGDVEHAKRIY
jgi:hypothetical protein